MAKRKNKRKFFLILLLILLLAAVGVGGYCNQRRTKEKNVSKEVEHSSREKEVFEKGYNLPVEEVEKEEAENDCENIMELILDIYEQAEKGESSNVVLSDETILEMQDKVKETGYPVIVGQTYSDMENYEEMENFLQECINGKSGANVMYQIRSDGGIGRSKYIFDGKDMYVLNASAVWNREKRPGIAYISYTRIKEWNYTEKGWFCYELCVPEPPEVTEVVDGSCMIRVKPMKEEYRELSEKCVFPIGYQGNNLLCSNWDVEHMEDLDYNGMYEYLYRMKYPENIPFEEYSNGIPKDIFENLIMEYLPVTAEQIQKYAVFDEESQTYSWARQGCSNYAPSSFGISVPEVTDIRENEDGTTTLTVDAVGEMMLCNEAVITHELTVRFEEDGSFQYLGNKILDDGIKKIPEYQYRCRN